MIFRVYPKGKDDSLNTKPHERFEVDKGIQAVNTYLKNVWSEA